MKAELEAALSSSQREATSPSALQLLHKCFTAFMEAVQRLEAPARNAETKQINDEFMARAQASEGGDTVLLMVDAMKLVRDRLDTLKVRRNVHRACASAQHSW